MEKEKKTDLFYYLFFAAALSLAGIALFPGCASTGAVIQAEKSGLMAAQTVSDSAPEHYEALIDSLKLKVDSMSERFMMLPGSRSIAPEIKEQWSSLVSEAEQLQKVVHANAKLGYLLGELYRVGIFFNAPDAAYMAEYHLSECVGTGGEETNDYRPFLSLAWLNLFQGCQLSEKTGDLLSAVEKRMPNKEYPYLAMLWGYYYYSCKHDPEKAIGYFQSYLAFDPLDKRVLKTYLSIKKQVSRKSP